MWLDDDGDDDPIAGPVPDPSERTWRHPSEIAAELARSAEADETSELPLALPDLALDVQAALGRDLRSVLRPLPLAGSCLAVAALGVVALFLFGPTTGDEIVAGSSPDLSNGDGLADATRSASTRASTPSATTTTTTARTTTSSTVAPFGARASETGELSTTTKPTTTKPPTTRNSSSTSRVSALSTLAQSSTAMTELPSEEVVVASAPTDGAIPGVYVASTDVRLASVVVATTDGFLLTSASALKNNTNLSFWTGDHWMDTQVLALDEPSDIAVLTLDASPRSLKLPELNPAQSPVKIGQLVTVGVFPNDGSGSYSAYSAAREADPAITKNKIAATGQVISVNNNEVLVWSGHQVFDLIRAEISFTPASAGAPLLNSDGETIGLIIGGDHPNTSAIPIETALAYARTLVETGSISTASIGIEAITTLNEGIRIDVISSTGPAASALQPGDVVVSVDGQPLLDVDHYHHLIRQVEPGATVILSIERARESIDVELPVEP